MDLITQFLDSMTYDEPSGVDWRDVVEEDSDDEVEVEEKSDRALLNQYIDDIPIEKQPDFLEYIKQRVKIVDPYAINNRTLLNQLWKEFTTMVGPSYPQINYGTQVNYGEVLRSAIDDVWKHLPTKHNQKKHAGSEEKLPIDWQLTLPIMRRRHGYTQAFISKESGVPVSVISNAETGKRFPSDDDALKILEVFGHAVAEGYQRYIDKKKLISGVEKHLSAQHAMTTTIYDLEILCKLTGIPFDLEEEKRKRGIADIPDDVLKAQIRKILDEEEEERRKRSMMTYRLAKTVLEAAGHNEITKDWDEKYGLSDVELEKHLPTQHDQQSHAGMRSDPKAEIAGWDGRRAFIAEVAISNMEAGDNGVVIRDPDGSIKGVASYNLLDNKPIVDGLIRLLTKVENDWFVYHNREFIESGDYLYVSDFATKEPGHGRHTMQHIIDDAADARRGIILYSLKSAEGFYTKLGMKKFHVGGITNSLAKLSISSYFYLTPDDINGLTGMGVIKSLADDEPEDGVFAVDVREKLIDKHLPTKHNQKTHGKPEGGVESSRSDFQKDILASEKPAEKWKTLSDDDKDKYANAKESIQARINGLTEKFGQHDLNASMQDIATNRLKQVDGLITQDAGKMLADRMGNYAQALTKAGVSEASAKKMIAQATDVLLVQENESLGRQLGDHGIRHVLGDVDMALDILSKHPAYDDPKAIVATYIAGIFHDTGYTTLPGGKVGMGGRHPVWSLQHYEANMKADIVSVIGQEWADKVGYMIKTHDSPDVDWDNDSVTSALRVADNMALFHKEKLPGLYKYAPQNIKVLMDLGEGKIDVKTAQTLMKKNVQESNLPKAVTERLFNAADEVFKYSPEFTLGMLGGHLESVEWKTDHLEVTAYRNNMAVRLQKYLDLGQRQFIKLAETYLGDDLSKLSSSGFTFDKNGKPIIRFTIIGEEIKSLLKLIDEIEKHLPGRHLQKEHGREKPTLRVVSQTKNIRVQWMNDELVRQGISSSVVRNVEFLSDREMFDKYGRLDPFFNLSTKTITIADSGYRDNFRYEFSHEVGHAISRKYPSLQSNFLIHIRGTDEEAILRSALTAHDPPIPKERYGDEMFAISYSYAWTYSNRSFRQFLPNASNFFRSKNWPSKEG